MSVKRYTLTRVGAGQGVAIFECAQLLGEQAIMVSAADYDALEAALRQVEFDAFSGLCPGCEGWHEHDAHCVVGLALNT